MSTSLNVLSTTAVPVAQSQTLDLKKYLPAVVKGSATGAIFYAISVGLQTNKTSKDQIKSALVVGVSSGLGSMLKEVFVPYRKSWLPIFSKTSSYEGRFFESGAAILGSYAIDKVYLRNSYNMQSSSLSATNVIAILVSDLCAEAISDIFYNRSINLLDDPEL